jgi:hypothetical protein
MVQVLTGPPVNVPGPDAKPIGYKPPPRRVTRPAGPGGGSRKLPREYKGYHLRRGYGGWSIGHWLPNGGVRYLRVNGGNRDQLITFSNHAAAIAYINKVC